ncbi:MAG: dickkopf-related protein [Deltaproteobacteria bacterium]
MAITGFACSGGSDDDGGVCLANEDAAAVQQDGDCCVFTINCQPGSICNIEGDDLYDADKAASTCIKVTCANDNDCDAPKVCSLEKTCKVPICQVDSECTAGDVCRDGACQPPFATSDVASCEVVTRDTAIRQGARITLEAVSYNSNGKVLAGIPYDWTSSAPDAVGVEDQDAVGGTVEATATLTAKPSGTSVDCTRSVSVSNFPNVGATDVRVVVVADDDGSPVGQANVIVDAGGTLTASTAANGAATVSVGAGMMPASVTVVKAGWQTVTILSPGTNDVFIPLPRIADETVAGGFRGSVDLSATENLDIQLGLVGPAIPSNLLDFGLESLIGDFVPTRINASQLMLDVEEDLPAGLMLGLGSQQFMADETRCQGDMPGANELGCFLARSPEGPGAGWALAGQLKISAVTSIANELSGVLGGDGGDLEIGPILTAVLPLLRGLNHAVNPSIVTDVFAKVSKPGQNADCSDPAQAADEDLCQGDFSKYNKVPMRAASGLSVLSTVNVPDLPDLPAGGCASGMVLLSGAALEGRGLVPLGVTAGVDVVDMGNADCRIDGIEEPFGERSDPLDNGQMPLSMAPLHSGIEGSDVFMLAVALDIDSIANSGGLSLSAIVHRVNGAVADVETIGGAFLGYPTGTITKSAGTVSVANTGGAKVTRIELQNAAGDTWLVYAPASETSITLPDIAATRGIVANTADAFLLTMSTDRNYTDVFTFGSGATLDRLFDFVNGFVITACDSEAGSQCEIAD